MTDPDRNAEFVWVRCRCGKERRERRDIADLAVVTLCGKCEAEFSKAMNMCPELVDVPNGISGCRLTWEHEGRCEPYEFDPQEIIEARRQAGFHNGRSGGVS